MATEVQLDNQKNSKEKMLLAESLSSLIRNLTMLCDAAQEVIVREDPQYFNSFKPVGLKIDVSKNSV